MTHFEKTIKFKVNNQMTIPQAIVRELGLANGDDLKVKFTNGVITVYPAKVGKGKRRV